MNRWVPALVASLSVSTFVVCWSGLLLLEARSAVVREEALVLF
jgi:hypothetical protein